MVYPIVKYGDPVLEREADEVTEFGTPDLDKFLEDMFESMYAAKGVGLAAPQIGFSRKIAVIDISNAENPADKLVLINPKILHVEGKQEGEEGCLSIPGFREQVKRGPCHETARTDRKQARTTAAVKLTSARISKLRATLSQCVFNRCHKNTANTTSVC